MRRPLLTVLVLATLLLSALAASPAESARSPWRGVLTFQKNGQHQFDSRLTWRLYQRQAGGTWKVVTTHSWRAGSGLPGPQGRNPCARSRGWLPNGTYRMRQYADYPGHYIKGRAFGLDDKACANGTVRHQLFVHTEQGAHNRQCPNRPGDQACRWEWPRINDYKSLGCIKMAPGDLAQLVALYHQHFRAGVRYEKGQVVLRVVG